MTENCDVNRDNNDDTTQTRTVADLDPDTDCWYNSYRSGSAGKAHLRTDCQYVQASHADGDRDPEPARSLHDEIELCSRCDPNDTVTRPRTRDVVASQYREPVTVDDLDDDCVLWRSTNTGGGDQLSLHLDPDCHHLPEDPRQTSAEIEHDDRDICQSCQLRGESRDDAISKYE